MGFAQAEDRLWQMVFNVKIATSGLSEVRNLRDILIINYWIKLIGDEGLDIDTFSKVVNFKDKCKKGFELISEEQKEL